MDIRYDDEHTVVVIENRILRFSPAEYKLIRLLLIHGIVTTSVLLEALSLQDTDETAPKLIIKYMNRVRIKASAYGIRICRIHGYGYMLIPAQ